MTAVPPHGTAAHIPKAKKPAAPAGKSGKPKTSHQPHSFTQKPKPKPTPHPVHRVQPRAKRQPKAKRGTGALPCCPAEALAASLRAAGWPVSAADVAALHALTGETSIATTLKAAADHGLAGVGLAWHGEASPGDGALILGVDWPGDHAVYDDGAHWWSWGRPWLPWTAVTEEAWAVEWETCISP